MDIEKKLLFMANKVGLHYASIAGLAQVVGALYKSIEESNCHGLSIESFTEIAEDDISVFDMVLVDVPSNKRMTVTLRNMPSLKSGRANAVKKVVEEVVPDIIVSQCGMLGYTRINVGSRYYINKSHLLMGLSNTDLTNVDCTIFGAISDSQIAFNNTPLISKSSRFIGHCYHTTIVVDAICDHVNSFFGTNIKAIKLTNQECSDFIGCPVVSVIDGVKYYIGSDITKTRPREKVKLDKKPN